MHDHFIEIKIYFLNLIAFGALFSEIDNFFKVLLSIVAIGYTLRRWVIMEKDRENQKKD